MRKILFIVLLFCFAVLPLTAESGKIEANDLGLSFNSSLPIIGEGLYEDESSMVPAMGIGVVYHPLPFLAVEPGVLLIMSDMEKNVDVGTDNGEKREKTWQGYSLGIFYYGDLGSGLYYYAGPRAVYYKYKYERTYETSNNDNYVEEEQLLISLAAGLKYMFNDNFSVFADFGFGFVNKKEEYETVDPTGVTTDKYTYETTDLRFTKGSLGATFYLW